MIRSVEGGPLYVCRGNILKLEVLGSGISGILRPNQRVIMSRFWEGLIVSFAAARAEVTQRHPRA